MLCTIIYEGEPEEQTVHVMYSGRMWARMDCEDLDIMFGARPGFTYVYFGY